MQWSQLIYRIAGSAHGPLVAASNPAVHPWFDGERTNAMRSSILCVVFIALSGLPPIAAADIPGTAPRTVPRLTTPDRNQPQDVSIDRIRHQGAELNGVSMNGCKLQGISLNGDSLNRISMNGISLNGDSLNRITLNGISLNGISFNGMKLQGISMNGSMYQGVSLNGIDWQSSATGGDPAAALTCRRPPMPSTGVQLLAGHVVGGQLFM